MKNSTSFDKHHAPHSTRARLRLSPLLTSFILTLAGCTVFPDAPPATLYALAVAPATTLGECPLKFAVRETRLPGYLDRPEVPLGLDGAKIKVSAQHLWGAPLAKELTRLLGLGLSERLKASQQLSFPVRASEKPDWMLSPSVNRVVINGQGVTLELSTLVMRFDGASEAKPAGPFLLKSSATISQVPSEQSNAALAETVAAALNQSLESVTLDLANAIKKELCP